MSRRIRSICVFCGSSAGLVPGYAAAARALAAEAVSRDLRVIYGGASVGLMGALADAVLEAGGEVVGVMPRTLVDREIAHGGLSELRIVNTMHERKALMAELADAFIALPGGIGTLEELFEIWTWGQLGIHQKPYGLLNVHGYYSPLIEFLDHAVDEGFVRPGQRALLHVASDARALLDLLAPSTSTA
jgi:uncharacterized protein (TIGR00730 family)